MELKKRGLAVFGGLTILTSALFSAGLTSRGTTTLVGPTVIQGAVQTTSTPREVYVERSTTSTSQVVMSERNTDTRPRVLTAVVFAMATATATGGNAVGMTIGLGPTANATGTTVLFNGFVPVPTDGKFAITTTSSLMTAYSTWQPNDYLTCILSSPTSTIVTKCLGQWM